jgi:S1-C subfamily serine protease
VRKSRVALLSLVVALVLAGATIDRATSATNSTSATKSPTTGVVLINTNLALQNASAAGTGIVLTKDGEVITNNHVIRGATTIKVVVPAAKRTYAATVLGYDITNDIALLKLQGATNLATVTRGNSATLKIGQPTRAIGNANGRGKLVTTTGRITGRNQTIRVQDETDDVTQLKGLIETSARLVPGDSGGPLLDSAGRVIGIDAAGSPSFGFDATAPGYAIPINRAWGIAKQVESQKPTATVHIGPTAFIGLLVARDPQGISVGSVVPNSPAASAGIQQGDVITALDGKPVTTFGDLRTLLFTKHPGDTVTVAYTPTTGGQTSVSIVLASGPPQ